VDGESWVFSSFVDYYDARTNAVARHSEVLSSYAPDDARDALDIVSRVVTQYARDLTEDQLVGATVSIVDDLYKTMSWINQWSHHTAAYVQAVFGSFLSVAAERGKRVLYIVENTFPEGFQRVVSLFPTAFQAAGIAFVCPHQVAAFMARSSGIALSDHPNVAELAPLIAEARVVALQAASTVVERGSHLAYLEADFEDGSLDDVRALPAPPGTITILREEAPMAGSRVVVMTT
jgi:hypothetical protein